MTTYLRDDLGYLNSRHYAVSSILYDDGRPAAGDIDLVSASFKNNGLIFGEFKQFVNGKNEVWIDSTKMHMLKLLATNIEPRNRKIFIAGTDDYSLTRPKDVMWITTLDSLLSHETESQTCGGNTIIQKEAMIPYEREAFSVQGIELLNHNCINSLTFEHLR